MLRQGIAQKKLIGIIVGAVALVAGAAVGGYYTFAKGKPRELKPLTADEAKPGLEEITKLSGDDRAQKLAEFGQRAGMASREDREKLFRDEEYRKVYDTLSDADKDKLREGMFQVRAEEMRKEVNEFFKAPPEKHNELLDKRLDEMTAMRNRPRPQRDAAKEGAAKADSKGGERKGGPGGWMEKYKNATDEQKKAWARERLNKSDPEDRAKMTEYWTRLRKRAEERGIQLGGPGGRR